MLGRTLEKIAAGERSLDELVAYDPATAMRRHREVAARWIGTQGLDVDADRIVVTNGAQHAITVILATFLQPGDTVIAEELTYPGLKAVADMLGLRVRGVALDDEGIVPDALAAACTDGAARAVYVVPTIQNPTGATMSAPRRRRLAEIAAQHDLLIVEDEIHVAMQRPPIAPIAAFAPDHTVHITTLCKWASFGLRVGFVAAPEGAVERIRSGVRSSLWMAAPLMVEVATRWIEDGTAERLARRKLDELEARYEMLDEIFGDRFDYVANPSALHIWLRLPEPMRSDELVTRARQRGVRVAGAEAFTVGRDVPAAVRVSIAAVPEREDLRRGLEILAELLSSDLDPCIHIV